MEKKTYITEVERKNARGWRMLLQSWKMRILW